MRNIILFVLLISSVRFSKGLPDFAAKSSM